MRLLAAIDKSNSKRKEAKRRVYSLKGEFWLYARVCPKKGFRVRQLKNGTKVRLDERFRKNPNDFDDWMPAAY